MSYEINVLVVGQNAPAKVPFETSICVLNECDNKPEIARYFEIWPFFMQTSGVLYSLGRMRYGDFFSALPICDSDFDHPLAPNSDTSWIPDEARECITPFIVFKDEICELERILSFLLDCSPQKLMMFHTRYQDGDTEIICGVMKKEQFFEKLERQELYFNVCYIVAG